MARAPAALPPLASLKAIANPAASAVRFDVSEAVTEMPAKPLAWTLAVALGLGLVALQLLMYALTVSLMLLEAFEPAPAREPVRPVLRAIAAAKPKPREWTSGDELAFRLIPASARAFEASMYALTLLLTVFWAIPTPTAPPTLAVAAPVAAAYAIATPKASARINVVWSWAVRLMLPPLPGVVVTSLLAAMCASIVSAMVFPA